MKSTFFIALFLLAFLSILTIAQPPHGKGYYDEGMFYDQTPIQFKRHISPSYDIEAHAGSLRSLLAVGKRQVSMASDIGNQMQMYNHLFDAGKKKRSAIISPAYNFQSSLGLSEALERAGRR